MINKIEREADKILEKMVNWRRDFHKYAESGWTEIRTASLIAEHLTDLGFEIDIGKQVIDRKARMGLPSHNDLNFHYKRALQQGAVKKYADQVKNGYTGIVTELRNRKGPVIGIRFDIDALGVQEAQTRNHKPYREGFSSVNEGVMHACGHDGHAATGMGLAEMFRHFKNKLNGTVRLIFQPAEEGVRGAKSMVKAGVVDDLDYLIGFHLLTGLDMGRIASGMSGYAATSKFDVTIKGKPAHAGGKPQAGNNALLAAANAVLNLYAISRHSRGATRLNVGKLTAGTGRNVICPSAFLEIETRGENDELNQFMFKKALNIIKKSAQMYKCIYRLKFMGDAPTANSDRAFMDLVETTAGEIGDLDCVGLKKTGGSEDFTYMMKRVQENEGLAVNIGIGAALQTEDDQGCGIYENLYAAHTSYFDFEEKAMKTALDLITHLVFSIMKNHK